MRFFIAISAAGLAVLPASGELPRGKTKPRPVCGIPNYAYSTSGATAKPTTTATTLVRIPASRLNPAAPGTPPQIYQLGEARMQVDHCYLSRVAVGLYEDGSYVISFRADQNPVVSDDPASPLRSDDRPAAATLQTGQLLRNQFVVVLRGYSNSVDVANPPKLGAARPALVEWKLQPFTVERGKPYSGNFSGDSPAVKKNFEFIDRIEVEFTYK